MSALDSILEAALEIRQLREDLKRANALSLLAHTVIARMALDAGGRLPMPGDDNTQLAEALEQGRLLLTVGSDWSVHPMTGGLGKAFTSYADAMAYVGEAQKQGAGSTERGGGQ